MSDYERNRVELERDGQVATLVLKSRGDGQHGESYVKRETNIHWQVADVLDELRADNGIRVIVLTSPEGTGTFFGSPSKTYTSEETQEYFNDPRKAWLSATGMVRSLQSMTEIEKPVVAKVNGDAYGFGQSLVFASDLIVAEEEAVVADNHLAMGEHSEFGSPEFGTVPGLDAALLPLYLPPTEAKEYLMLAKRYTAAELAERGIVNYAVPEAELDERVEGIVERLLERSAYALAWTKRVANRRVAEHLNRTLDAGAAYKEITFLQAEYMDWTDTKQLNWDED